MLLQRRGWDIHAVSAEPGRAADRITGHGNVPGTQEHQEPLSSNSMKVAFTPYKSERARAAPRSDAMKPRGRGTGPAG